MIRHQKGQGLVEYSLILVLVAVVVIVREAILGPAIGDIFCSLVPTLGSARNTNTISLGNLEVNMGLDDLNINIDVKPDDATWVDYVDCWGYTTAAHGIIGHHGDGTYTYYRNDLGSETDDSFTYTVYFYESFSEASTGSGTVTIIIGERDEEPTLVMSEARSVTTNGEESKEPDIDDAREKVIEFYEAALQQEESISEGVDLNLESVVEGLEVLQDYAGDLQNQLFYENVSQFAQAVDDGNLDMDTLSNIYSSLTSDLAETPIDIYVSMNLKMAPRLIAACEVVSNGTVSNDLMDTALQAVEALDDNHPGKPETMQLLQDLGEVVEARNIFIQAHTDFQVYYIGKIIELLELAGEEELADQLTLQSESCGY